MFSNVTIERLHRCTISEPEAILTSGYTLDSLVSRDAFQSSIGWWFQFPIDTRCCLNRHLEVAGCSVSTRVCRVNGHVLESSDRNHCSFRDKCDLHRSRHIRGVDSSTSLVKVDGITLLFVYQLYDVALRTAKFWRCYICE